MTAIDALFQEHWHKLSPFEPATAEHYAHFCRLQGEYPMLSVADLVAYTYADSLTLAWDEVEN